MRQHLVGQAFLVDVERAGRHFMQRRLPDMGQPAVNERDMARAKLAAELAGQFQAAGAAADDDKLRFHSGLLKVR